MHYCVICSKPVDMFRKGNPNRHRTPLCKKLACQKERKLQLQRQRRKASKRTTKKPKRTKHEAEQLVLRTA